MLSTAVAFHQISLLGEQGLTTTEAARNFLPQTAAAVAATLTMGALVDRFGARWVTAACMALLTAAMAWATTVAPGWSAIRSGVSFGGAAGP